jgi:hypothetical protein
MDEPIKSKYITNEEQVISTKYTEEIKESAIEDNKEETNLIIEDNKEETNLIIDDNKSKNEIIIPVVVEDFKEETEIVEKDEINEDNIIDNKEEIISTIEDKDIVSINVDEIIIEEKSIINNINNDEKPISPKDIFDEDRPIKLATNVFSEDQPIKTSNNSQSTNSKWAKENEFAKEQDNNKIDADSESNVKKLVKVTTTTSITKKDVIIEENTISLKELSDEDRPIKSTTNVFSEDQPIKTSNSQSTNSKWTEQPDDNALINEKTIDKSPSKIATKVVKSTTPKKSISSNALEEQISNNENAPTVEGEPDTRPLNTRLGDKVIYIYIFKININMN